MPTLDEVIERYREARRTVAAIGDLPPEQVPAERERLIIRAYLATFKTIEGAIFYEASRVLTGVANPAALNFVDALGRLSRPLRLPASWVSELKAHRVMRNQIEHGGGVLPRISALNDVLHHAERLLVEVLHVARESIEPDQTSISPFDRDRPAPWAPFFGALVAPTDPGSLLDAAINKGITLLREARRHGEALTSTLASDAQSLIFLSARTLWRARLPPDAALPEYEPVNDFLRLETELLDAARSGKTVDPTKLRILVRRVGLCEDAGWLVRHRGKLHFASEMVPALALRSGLTPSKKNLAEVLEMLAIHPLWGLALQGAIHQSPASADAWLKLLRARDEPTTLLSEIVAVAFILGALRRDTPIRDSELTAARNFVLHGIILLGPRKSASLAWVLPPPTFWSCVLCLASASTALGERLAGDVGPRPTRLARLAVDLDLEPAFASDEAEALAAFAMPWQALRAKRFTKAHSIAVQGLYSRTSIEGAHPLVPWVLEVFAPAGLANDAVDLLSDLDHGDFGSLLVQTSKSRPIWIKAWSRLLGRDPDRATTLCVRVLRERLSPTPGIGAWGIEVLRPLLEHLRAARLEGAVKNTVRAEILTWSFPEESTDNHRALFDWAALRPSDWDAGLGVWKTRSTLSWALLRDCGAPHSVLARWALHFLKERESVPQAFRDGPVGIVSSPNLRATQAGAWKVAFNEARECLDWLLAHGDEEALHVIADAALAPQPGLAECDIPYVYAEQVRLWLSLGQIFWPRVLARKAGRTVLYERLDAGKYIGPHCWPSFDWQWVIDAASRSDARLAREAPLIFEAYVNFCSIQWHPEVVRHDQPWDHPPPNISVDWHSFMLMLAACHNILVLDEWRRVVVRFRESMPHFGATLAAVYAKLAEVHPDAVAHTSEALPDDVLTALCVDGSRAFWAAWLDDVGLEFFRERVDALCIQDLGTGVITTMIERDRNALAVRLAEPRYFTPFLRVARDPAIYDDVHLRKLLWEQPRDVAGLAPLLSEPRGPWLDALLEFSTTWPPESRRAALVALARNSSDPSVRAHVLAALRGKPSG